MGTPCLRSKIVLYKSPLAAGVYPRQVYKNVIQLQQIRNNIWADRRSRDLIYKIALIFSNQCGRSCRFWGLSPCPLHGICRHGDNRQAFHIPAAHRIMRKDTVPPADVYLTAFPIRFIKIWFNFSGSAITSSLTTSKVSINNCGKTDNCIHGRADVVAHIGQEGCFCLVGIAAPASEHPAVPGSVHTVFWPAP